jgi:hypothetical protein
MRWARKGKTSIWSRIFFFLHDSIVSAVKKVEVVSDRMSYTVLRGCWCNTVLNVLAPSEEKSDG